MTERKELIQRQQAYNNMEACHLEVIDEINNHYQYELIVYDELEKFR